MGFAVLNPSYGLSIAYGAGPHRSALTGFAVLTPSYNLSIAYGAAASVSRPRNQDCAGSPAVRRCHAIDTVVA